jgi:hypothetical protein
LPNRDCERHSFPFGDYVILPAGGDENVIAITNGNQLEF